MKFLFVGERPSHQAVKIGATWQNGRLAGKQLRDALLALNINPDEHRYCNLYTRPDVGAWDRADEMMALCEIRDAQNEGLVIVGMGAIVCAVLAFRGVPHLQLIHPAARGAIRKKERYTSHVRSVLFAE